MTRIYVEGHEIDVQDPSFFIEEEKLLEIQETIQEILFEIIK